MKTIFLLFLLAITASAQPVPTVESNAPSGPAPMLTKISTGYPLSNACYYSANITWDYPAQDFTNGTALINIYALAGSGATYCVEFSFAFPTTNMIVSFPKPPPWYFCASTTDTNWIESDISYYAIFPIPPATNFVVSTYPGTTNFVYRFSFDLIHWNTSNVIGTNVAVFPLSNAPDAFFQSSNGLKVNLQ